VPPCLLIAFGNAGVASPEQPATVAVHLSPADVVALPDYQVSSLPGVLAASPQPPSWRLLCMSLECQRLNETPAVSCVLQAWMAGCGPDAQHIVVNAAAPGSAPTMLPSAAAVLARLNVLAPSVFPLLPHSPATGKRTWADSCQLPGKQH
jgi:hypothetical protein